MPSERIPRGLLRGSSKETTETNNRIRLNTSVFLVSAHLEMKFGYELVSNSEVDDFSQVQGNQGIVRRRAYGTSHKQSRRLT
jgi:hypothetical protein